MHPALEGAVAAAPVVALAAYDAITTGAPSNTGEILERYGILAIGIGGLWVAYQRLVSVVLKALSANTEAMNAVKTAVETLNREVRDLREDFRTVESRTSAVEGRTSLLEQHERDGTRRRRE